MEGTRVFKFAVEAVPWCMDRVLERTGYTLEDVDFFVFHQANARIIDLAARKYRIPPEKYYKNIAEYGNTSAASIPLVLSELEDMGRVLCHQTNHGPGHHSSYALVDGVPIVGISGPSGGASFTLNFYLLPLMKRFLGLDPAPVRIPARLASPFPGSSMDDLMKADPASLPGEQRPAEATEPGSRFYSIRFVVLAAAPDGMLSATPVPGKAGSPQPQHANAYFMMPAGADDVPPQAGDVISVELRNPALHSA